MAEPSASLSDGSIIYGLVAGGITIAMPILGGALRYYSVPAAIQRTNTSLDHIEVYLQSISATHLNLLDEHSRDVLEEMRTTITQVREIILGLSLLAQDASIHSQYAPTWCGMNPLKEQIHKAQAGIDRMRRTLLASTQSLRDHIDLDGIWNSRSDDTSASGIRSEMRGILDWLSGTLPLLPLPPIEVPELSRESIDVGDNSDNSGAQTAV